MTRAQNDKAGNQDFARKQEVLLKGGGTALPLPDQRLRARADGVARGAGQGAGGRSCACSPACGISPCRAARTDAAAKAASRVRGVPEVTAEGNERAAISGQNVLPVRLLRPIGRALVVQWIPLSWMPSLGAAIGLGLSRC